MLRQRYKRGAGLAKLRCLKRKLSASDLAFVVIDTHNLMSLFMRSYCLSSLAGAYTATGRRITNTQSIQGFDSAITFSITTSRPSLRHRGPPWRPTDEPKWHDPKVVVKVLYDAGCSNALGVRNVLSPLPTAITHWTRARNFLAHRNARTAAKVRNLGINYRLGLPRDPLTVLSALNVTGGKMIVEEWFKEVGEIISDLPN